MTRDSDLDFLVIKDDVPYRGIDRIRELIGLIEKNCAADFLVYRPQEAEELLRKFTEPRHSERSEESRAY